jgi:hypothetical protein
MECRHIDIRNVENEVRAFTTMIVCVCVCVCVCKAALNRLFQNPSWNVTAPFKVDDYTLSFHFISVGNKDSPTPITIVYNLHILPFLNYQCSWEFSILHFVPVIGLLSIISAC